MIDPERDRDRPAGCHPEVMLVGRALFFVFVTLLGCGAEAQSTDGPPTARTYILKVPVGYDGSTPLPLIVALHAYSADDSWMEQYFGLDAVADQRGFFVVYPDGTVDQSGKRFFNATDACCDFYDTGVDDVAFIASLLDRIESTYAIDTSRVYAVGHSNGAFMSHRLACDLSTRFAAIISLEGATWDDPSRCRPTEPVAVLEVRGTDDTVIAMNGGNVVDGYPNRVYPSLAQTMATSAALDGCDGTVRSSDGPGDIDSETPLPTTAQEWSGCKADVELWLNQGGTHNPQLTSVWPEAIADFLLAHRKSPAVAVSTILR